MSGKIALNDTVVTKFNITRKPIIKDDGKLGYIDNPDGKPYIVFDAGTDSPIGFGVKVGKTSKTYIIQRRVNTRVIKAKVGAVKDFATSGGIVAARDRAREISREMLTSGRNPNVVKREKAAGQLTLDDVFEGYIAKLHRGGKVPPENTLKSIRSAKKRLASWAAVPVRELTFDEIEDRFNEIASKTRTAAEQTFRWCTTATNHFLKEEVLKASHEGRQPTLSHNPFDILRLKGAYRSRTELQEEAKAKGVSNPLTMEKSLGDFLNALWDRRKANRTGCDYLLLMLLWGCRKSEHAGLMWRELLSKEEAALNSWVDLKEGKVHFHATKNKISHELPITDSVREILIQRQQYQAERMDHEGTERLRQFVFPGLSPDTKSSHYRDAGTLLKYIREDAGIAQLTQHDFRRTFGRVAEALGIPEMGIKRLLNHMIPGVTGRYTQPEWQEMKKRLQRIEDAILATAPRVYNAVKPINKPPMHYDGTWERRPQRRKKNDAAMLAAAGGGE